MYRFVAVAVAAVAMVLMCLIAADSAQAQVPPHQPGTVCATPQFWCWAQYPGPPGGGCACPSPYGWVPGRLI